MEKTRYVKIDGYSSLGRDIKTGSVLNLDGNSYAQFRATKLARKAQSEKLVELELEIANLKHLVLTLAERLTKQ